MPAARPSRGTVARYRYVLGSLSVLFLALEAVSYFTRLLDESAVPEEAPERPSEPRTPRLVPE